MDTKKIGEFLKSLRKAKGLTQQAVADELYVFALDLFVLLISYFIYMKSENKKVLIYPIFIAALICCLYNNYSDKLVTKEDISLQHNTYNYSILSSLIDEDEDIYRVGNDMFKMRTLNRVVDIDYYLPSMYSSLSNMNYYNFVNNDMFNEMEYRISTAISSSKNIMFNTLMGTKYIVSNSGVPIGYTNINDSNVYVNENVLPIGYATKNIISKNDFEELSYPDKVYSLISSVVVDNDVEYEYKSKIKEENLDYSIELNDVTVKDEINKYVLDSKENGNIKLKLNKPYKNKMLFISFDMGYSQTCLIGDTSIIINGVKNTLSCRGWTYHNKNYGFEYVISSNDEISELFIEFSEGKYEISNIKVYSLDYKHVLDSVSTVDEFKINKELTIGDKIVGDININRNGYFVLSIPYEERGFSIYLDEQLIDYEMVNNAFIGFPINEGHHKIEIIYTAPYLLEGMIVSILGYMIFLPIIYSDFRKRK